MARQLLPFVIVGHVDHGKSTLIGRLLYETRSLSRDRLAEAEATSSELGRDVEFAFILDSLEEERTQGITIETTQVFFKTPARDYVIIDAPGHVEFIKNMVTGASQAEAAVVIIDAHEGIQEQTRRHSFLVDLLGIRQIAVVINKMDKVGCAEPRFAELRTAVEEFLASLGRRPAVVIPISARDGDNVAAPSARMPWYAGPTLLQQLDRFQSAEPLLGLGLRMPIQDVYKIADKRILVGRVERGTISTGQELAFVPGGRNARVRTIEVFRQDGRTRADEGESIGITIDKPLFVERGQVAFPGEHPGRATSDLQARLFWMSRDPLEPMQPLTFRCATQEAGVDELRIHRRIDSSTLAAIEQGQGLLAENEVAEATLRTRAPVVVEPMPGGGELGRFVLTRGDDVVAGGIVTAAAAP